MCTYIESVPSPGTWQFKQQTEPTGFRQRAEEALCGSGDAADVHRDEVIYP